MKKTIILLLILSSNSFAYICEDNNNGSSDITTISSQVANIQLSSCKDMNKKQALELFQKIYPYQSLSLIQKKLDESKTKALFFRSFVSYFHYLIKDLPQDENFTQIFNKTGLIIADPHPENFGIKVYKDNKKDKVIEYIGGNDFDDSIQGPFMADYLRFSSSIKYFHSGDLKQKELLNAYMSGLKNDDKLSIISQELKTKSKESGRKISKKYYSKKEPNVFKNRKEPSRQLTTTENSSLKEIISRDYPGKKIYDSYIYTKSSGGSAGQDRFEVLVGEEGKKKKTWIEIKPIAPKGASLFENLGDKKQDLKASENHMKSAIKMFISDNTDDYKVIKISGKPYVARKRWRSDKSYDFFDKDTATQHTILLDQAKLLGKQHRKSMKNDVDEYIGQLETFKSSDQLELTIDKLQSCIDHTFNILKQ